MLDFSQPVAVLLVAVLHFVADAEDPYGLVRALMDPMPAGSYLVISHFTADSYDEQADVAAQGYQNATSAVHSRHPGGDCGVLHRLRPDRPGPTGLDAALAARRGRAGRRSRGGRATRAARCSGAGSAASWSWPAGGPARHGGHARPRRRAGAERAEGNHPGIAGRPSTRSRRVKRDAAPRISQRRADVRLHARRQGQLPGGPGSGRADLRGARRGRGARHRAPEPASSSAAPSGTWPPTRHQAVP